MYLWRKLTEEQQKEALEYRRLHYFPKHSPPHFDFAGKKQYLITAACYEHKHIISKSTDRMADCESRILSACEEQGAEIYAWCILPNHYHILLMTDDVKGIRKQLGLFHGRSSFKWNGEDNCRGRQVWHNCFERRMKSERHYFATLNYVLNNPVHHGYCKNWEDWPWSNASEYLGQMGRDKALKIWRDYPIKDYGKKWDVF